MTTNYDIIRSYAQNAGRSREYRHAKDANVYASGDTIYSYGSHFPMAVLLGDRSKGNGWWLVNGDTYSMTTTRHQRIVREELKRTCLPMLIVPFSALESAGIERQSIIPVQVLADTWAERTERRPLKDLPKYMQSGLAFFLQDGTLAEVPGEPGLYDYTHRVHVLGESLFRAGYYTYETTSEGTRRTAHRRYFLSAFDEQDNNLYFLAELPARAHPATVEEAREALRPPEVSEADAAGIKVVRQGDVFAVPVEVSTRQLSGHTRRGAYVLGTSHTATEVRVHDGKTYARGCLRHKPKWRRPEHRLQQLGRDWHLLVKNTVPEGRSWSISGNTD